MGPYWIRDQTQVSCAGRQTLLSFPHGSDGKESAYNAGDPGSIPKLGRSPGEGNGNPLQYSCPENLINNKYGGTLYEFKKKKKLLFLVWTQEVHSNYW